MKENKYNKEYWLDLQKRYFDAETTDDEERQLMSFAASTDDDDFRELQAVMGFACAKKKAMTAKGERQEAKGQSNRYSMLHRLSIAAAAAVVALLVMVPFVKGDESDCLMIAEGETTTNREEVISEMDREIAMLFNVDEENTMESELNIIFN